MCIIVQELKHVSEGWYARLQNIRTATKQIGTLIHAPALLLVIQIDFAYRSPTFIMQFCNKTTWNTYLEPL